MNTRKAYATELTKAELVAAGITLVTKEGYVFKGDKQVVPTINSAGY